MSQFSDRIAHEWDPAGADAREAEEQAWEETERLLRLREAASPWLDDDEGTDFD